MPFASPPNITKNVHLKNESIVVIATSKNVVVVSNSSS